MRFASITEVAKLPRLAPLSLASVRRGGHASARLLRLQKHGPLIAHSRINQESHSPSQPQWSWRGRWWNILRVMNGKVFPGVASEQQQPPHCNGRQGWSLPSFLPSPPSALTLWAAVTAAVTVTGSHGRNHSASWAGGEGGGERGTGMRRGSAQKPQQQQQRRRVSRISSAIPAGQGTAAEGDHAGGAGAPAPTVCGGMDAAANNVGLL